MDGEVLVGVIAAGAALGGAFLGAAGAVAAGRNQARAMRYQADAQWIRELLPSLYAEFITQAEQVYQEFQTLYENAFQGQWDAMESRARDLDPQPLKRAFTALELRAPQSVVDEAYQLRRTLLFDDAPELIRFGTLQQDRAALMTARAGLAASYASGYDSFLNAARTSLGVRAEEADSLQSGRLLRRFRPRHRRQRTQNNLGP
ncbi:hypothetical protein OG413_36945 [Streptomyces sp. NBC_01433]|uniref:hypothetical protein n=1 Tax=Streptomyces sp. NBC_01433 TaxID=2903864 RepID=UPI00224E3A37|nr:hypothetical protein [Streptomyces sp. NBC_01433]MCX4680803.1 hypothetical protein [Streptomyces sp. NBC_01433]